MPDGPIGEPPDPVPVSTLAELTGHLQVLRSWAGRPSLRRLRQLGGTRPAVGGGGEVDALPESTMSYVLRGDRQASAEFVRSFVAACLRARERDPDEIAGQVERWHQAWLAATGHTAPARIQPAGDPSPLVPVPRQLPAGAAGFTGRTGELVSLLRLLPGDRPAASPPAAISVITGTAGVGKTALAVHAAHRMADRFPDGQLFIDLRGFTAQLAPVEPGDALDRLLRVLGVPGERIPVELDDRAGLWRSVLARRQMLILLDNAATEEQVRPLLPGAAGCLVLITSRRRLSGLEATVPVSLDLLPAADAVALFAHAAGPDRLATSTPDQLAEAVEQCGRLPLAIRIAAARLRSHPTWRLADLVARLRGQDRRLAELTEEDGPRSVAAALAVSYQQLSVDQQHLYRLLGLHSGPDIEPYAAAALLEADPPGARRLLDQLLDAHLLQEPTPDRYTFHDLVRAHATTTGPARGWFARRRRRAAGGRLLDYYRHAASLAMDAAYPYERERRPRVPPARTPGPDLAGPAMATGWLDSELSNLLAAVRHAAAHGWPEHSWQLATTLHRHLRTRGRYRDAEALHRQALATARAAGHRGGELAALTGLGDIHRLLGQYPSALAEFGQALTIARNTHNHPGEVEALLGVGRVHQMRDRSRQALDYFGQALAVARRAGHLPGELEALSSLGDTLATHGRYRQALDHFGQALAIARSTGNHPGELNTLRGTGKVHRTMGRYPEAVDDFTRSLQIARATGNRPGELGALIGLGEVHRLQRRWPQAVECFEQVLELNQATGHHNGELNGLIGLGEVLRLLGRYREATARYQRVLDIARDIGDRNWQFEALHGLGRLHHSTGRMDLAVAHHRQALELATELGHPADQARAHDGLGHAHRALRQRPQARQHWQRALDILAELGTDYTEDEEANTPAIRSHLTELDPG